MRGHSDNGQNGMRRRRTCFIWACIAVAAIVSGCASHNLSDDSKGGIAHYQELATEIEIPAVPAPSDASLAHIPPPPDLRIPDRYSTGT